MWKSILSLTLAATLLAAAANLSVAQEADLIAVLKSNATQKEKADACRALQRVGTKAAVPTLAAMLDDPQLAHMARYALEPIPDPSVDVALREALGKVTGRPLLGVIGSLGVRRDGQAVGALAKLLADADTDVAQSAARALGKIGTPAAGKALEGALAGASDANLRAFCEGLFRCAEALSAEKQAAQAQAIYDRLRGLAQAPQQIRAGSLRGAILTRQKAGVPLLVEAIQGADYVLTMAAARAALELPGPEVTAALAAELPKLPADKQVLLIKTLGYRGDAGAGPALLALAAQGDEAVRLAAINNLTHLGYAPALPLLAELSLITDSEVASTARTCLSSFPGKDAEATILAMLTHKDAKVRGLAVEMVGQRKLAGSIAGLLKAAADDAEESVRLTALKALRDYAGVAELPALLQILVKAKSPADTQAAESAVTALCARSSELASGNIVIVKAVYGDLPDGPSTDATAKVRELVKAGAMAVEASNGNFGDPINGKSKKLRVDYTANGVPFSKTVAEQETVTFTASSTPPAVADALCGALAGAQGGAKLALLRTLKIAGGAKALQAVQAATSDSDAQTKDTALRILCDWATPDALPLLAELVKNPPSKTIKILALRGFVRLVPQQDAPTATKLAALKDAMAQSERVEEKRLVLSALGNIPAVETLAQVTTYLDEATLKEEACQAAVAIGEKIVSQHGAEVAAALTRVAKLTADKKLAAQATTIAGQAKK